MANRYDQTGDKAAGLPGQLIQFEEKPMKTQISTKKTKKNQTDETRNKQKPMTEQSAAVNKVMKIKGLYEIASSLRSSQ